MVPSDKDDIDPAVNAVQTLIAVRKGGGWKVALFQNTPAALHAKADAVKKLTEELRAALIKQGPKQ
jgi:hypothetical protein